ncbi:MAG: hypothetical protein LRY27_00330 [Chitinophagales bacterium]|nr:hypothetical protein [Chitinophagales bacterium]
MDKELSVKKALILGHLFVNIPALLTMFLVLGVGVLAAYKWNASVALVVFIILLSFILSWLYWSFAVVNWKIWAFGSVRNVHDLKIKAERNGIIWKKSSIFNKTEIWTKKQKLKWSEIVKKFEKKDVFEDDRNVPSETKIYYSKIGNAIALIGLFLLLMSGIFLAWKIQMFFIKL